MRSTGVETEITGRLTLDICEEREVLGVVVVDPEVPVGEGDRDCGLLFGVLVREDEEGVDDCEFGDEVSILSLEEAFFSGVRVLLLSVRWTCTCFSKDSLELTLKLVPFAFRSSEARCFSSSVVAEDSER